MIPANNFTDMFVVICFDILLIAHTKWAIMPICVLKLGLTRNFENEVVKLGVLNFGQLSEYLGPQCCIYNMHKNISSLILRLIMTYT